MIDEIDPREYGRMEAQVEQLAKDVHELKQTVETMRDMMQQAQGGWKAIALVSGIAGTVGGVITWAASHIKLS